jgi:DNA polymerase-3 subunit delta'
MARAGAARNAGGGEAEALPEADRLGEFPHPRETLDLIGHTAAEQTLAQAFAGGRLHHAWLLAGRAGIGKATLAYRMARHVLARPEERDRAGRTLAVPASSAAARQIAQQAHPALLVLRRPYDPQRKRLLTVISVEEVRRLRAFLTHTVGAEGWRVVIVDSADELNIAAANALLKSLEEPPPRALFLLVTARPSALLPTIRSRCRRLELAPLDGDSLRRAATAALEAAGEKAPAAAKWPQLERYADGSVRAALQLATGGLDVYERVAGLISRLPAVDWPALHSLADTLATEAQAQRLEMFLGALLDTLARLIHVGASREGTPEETALAARLIPEPRLPAWAETWQVIRRDKADAEFLNLDRKALLLRTFARLEAVSRG